MEIQDNIQWHPAFCSAVELELRAYKKYLIYEREHNLSKMPLKIDLDAKLADSAAEIAKLKKMLSEAGIQV